MRRMVLAGMLAALAGASLAQPAPKPPKAPELKLAVDKMRDGDFVGSYALVRPLTQDPDLAKWDEAYRHAAWFVLGVDANFLDKPQEALAALRRSSIMAFASGEDWYARLLSAEAARAPDDAVLSLTTLAETYPPYLQAVTDRAVARTLRAAPALPMGGERQGRLMGALLRNDWRPKDPSLDDWSWLWAQDAARLLDQGDVAGAAKAATRSTWPRAVIAMGADRRFDALRAAAPAPASVAAAYAARVNEAQAAVDAQPRSLQARNALIGALLIDQRSPRALALAQQASDAGAAGFDDAGDLNWTLDLKARALFAQGRGVEGLAALAQAAQLPEDGGANVSQRLALAARLLATDRADGALGETARVLANKDASVYGRMSAQQIAVCAHADRSQSAALAPLLTALKARAASGPDLLMRALVCANERRAAADLIVRRLADPATRLETLVWVQTYPQPVTTTAYEQTQRARLAAILALPDVKAAIDRVGRVQDQPRADIDW